MDSELLPRLLGRYYRGETTLAEEEALRSHLAQRAETGTADTLTPEERAAAEMLRLAETERKTKVVIRLHEAPARPWRIAVATALSAAAIVAVAVTLNRPTVYGYVNGRPVTSLAEARTCTEDLFSDMHAGKADRTAPLREILDIE